jgi:hypothetical protein
MIVVAIDDHRFTIVTPQNRCEIRMHVAPDLLLRQKRKAIFRRKD